MAWFRRGKGKDRREGDTPNPAVAQSRPSTSPHGVSLASPVSPHKIRKKGGLMAINQKSGDKPTLTSEYLREHYPIAYNTKEMQDAYALLGYSVVQQVFDQIMEKLGREGQVEGGKLPIPVDVTLTLDTTWQSGGCTVICSGATCIHQPRRYHGEAPGGRD